MKCLQNQTKCIKTKNEIIYKPQINLLKRRMKKSKKSN